MKKVRMDIQGKRFGHLLVLEYAYTDKGGKSKWKCLCDCGKEKIIQGSHLVSGHTTSCGCYRLKLTEDLNKTHGLRQTRLYRIWLNMKSRCTIPKSTHYKHYGGRGISICEEWSHGFQTFYDWAMSHGYSDNLSIDRIDVNGNYCPENCRWATAKEQRANQRRMVKK